MNPKYFNTDVEGLVKDPNSGAVLNIDNSRLEAYKRQKAAMKLNLENNERINKVEKEKTETGRVAYYLP